MVDQNENTEGSNNNPKNIANFSECNPLNYL